MKIVLRKSPHLNCSESRYCLQKRSLSVKLLDHEALKVSVITSTFELWKLMDEKKRDYVAGAILFFEERKFDDKCAYCDICIDVEHLGMNLKQGFVDASNEKDIPFEAFGPQAFVILKKFLMSIKIVPKEKSFTFARFCLRAAKYRKKGRLRAETALVWSAVSAGCDHCLISYQSLVVPEKSIIPSLDCLPTHLAPTERKGKDLSQNL